MKPVITKFNDKTGDFEITIPVPFTLKDGIEYVDMMAADIPKYEDTKDYNVFDLIRENQELKKQLHKSSLEIQHLIEQDIDCPSNCDKLRRMKEQQKEFIEWLEKEIKETETTIEMLCDTNSCRIPYLQNKNRLLKEILLNYKEIIGGSNANVSRR